MVNFHDAMFSLFSLIELVEWVKQHSNIHKENLQNANLTFVHVSLHRMLCDSVIFHTISYIRSTHANNE